MTVRLTVRKPKTKSIPTDLADSNNSEENHDGTVDSAETKNEQHSEEDDEQ